MTSDRNADINLSNRKLNFKSKVITRKCGVYSTHFIKCITIEKKKVSKLNYDSSKKQVGGLNYILCAFIVYVK